MVNDVLADLNANFEKVLEALKRDLQKVRTGRANLSVLDGVKVDYYGQLSPLNQVASLQVPDARMITVKPWEKSLIPKIEAAIRQQSDLGLNPSNDGEIVRLPIPPLTQERRKELSKVVRRMAEDAKVAARNHRREGNEMLKTLKGDGDISEDDEKTGLKKIQESTDKVTGRIDEIAAKKEAEIMEV
jgi:ribosome recycling factor